MAEGNAEIVRQAFDAVERGDKEALFALLRPGVEWQTIGLLSDRAPVYRGREEIWAYARAVREQFEDLRVEIVEASEIGDQVVVRIRIRGRPVGGEELDVEFSSVMRVQDGRIVRADNYEDHVEAVTDAELRLGTAG